MLKADKVLQISLQYLLPADQLQTSCKTRKTQQYACTFDVTLPTSVAGLPISLFFSSCSDGVGLVGEEHVFCCHSLKADP